MPDILRRAVAEALESVTDPETGLSLPAMGLIYDTRINGGDVEVTMTTTTRGCPMTGLLSIGVEHAVLSVPGVRVAQVKLTWDPPWDASRIRA